MITGFSGLGLNELVGAMTRARNGQPPTRDIQPMPKMDTVHFSRRGREMAATGQANGAPGADGNERTGRGHHTAHSGQSVLHNRHTGQAQLYSKPQAVLDRPVAVGAPPQATGEMSLMDRIKASFFTGKGDTGFDATADLNADGRINHSDLAVLRAQEQPRDPKEMLEQMQRSIFSRVGNENFDAGLDLNTDGIINFADLALLRERMETPMTRPAIPVDPVEAVGPAVTAPAVEVRPASEKPRFDGQTSDAVTVDTLRGAFFSRTGDASFNATADLNGDGQVNFADLAELRNT